MTRSLSVDVRRRIVVRLRADCRVERRLSDLASVRRARSGGGLRNGARAILRPKLQGGDRHSQRIEAHAELILSALAAKSDITLSELREKLSERGIGVAIGTLWRFFKRRKITRKKSRRTPPNSVAAR